jgi:hypothetical protein
MNYVSPFIMKSRNDAYIFFKHTLDITAIERFIWDKRKEGLSGFGFMHTIIAAYVRLISQRPAFNRFISGQRIYQHEDIVLSMMVKKSMELNSQETGIKVVFYLRTRCRRVPEDGGGHRRGEAGGGQHRARQSGTHPCPAPFPVPPRFVGLMNLMDYLGIMPKFAYKASPFHASLFVSNLGSIGLPAAFHHLYNFGNIPLFLTFGNKYSKTAVAGRRGEQEKIHRLYRFAG